MKTNNTINYNSYINPKYVYIPFDQKDDLKIRRDKLSYVGLSLGKDKNENNVISTVSGKILGIEEVLIKNITQNALVIENDYLDKVYKLKGCKKDITIFKRKEASELFKNYNINLKFNNKEYLVINTGILNNLPDENKIFILENTMEFLESVDALCEIYNLQSLIIVNSSDKILIETLKRYIGMYPKIEIKSYSNYYSNEKLNNKLFNNKKDKFITTNSKKIMDIYYILKRNLFNSYMYISVVHNKNEIIIKTKIGVLLEEILKILKITINNEIILITEEEKIKTSYKNLILTSDIKSIMVN